MKLKTKGFTLIELMIVIAIIGILMAYAIPAYRDYATRSKAGECLSLMSSVKFSVSERWNNSVPLASINSNAAALVSAPAQITGAYVASVEVESDGEIVCNYNALDADLSGATIRLIPDESISVGSLQWSCSNAGFASPSHVPGGC